MTGIRWFATIVLSTALAADVSAQIVTIPVPAVPVLVPNGIDFWYNSKNLKASGFIGTGGYSPGFVTTNPLTGAPTLVYPYYGYRYPYGPSFPPVILGSVEQRNTLQIINPPGYVPRPVIIADTSGIDLDVESSAKIWGKKPDVRVAARNEKEAPGKKPEPVPVAKLDAVKQPEPAPVPKIQVVDPLQHQLDTGATAFRNGEYGIALVRFRQVAEAEKPLPKAPFLQAQAYIAVGKYHDAVQAIQQGLQRAPDWLASNFRPRTELYGKDDDTWIQHLKRLEQAQRQNPKDGDYLFLLGYLAWFDGRKEAAVDYLRQSRPLADDPRWADLFLKAAKK
jgi:Tetratricopeptide repeat